MSDKIKIYGTLINHFETGTEGVWWALQKAPSGFAKGRSYEDLYLLHSGDVLEIYDPDALYSRGEHKILWTGTIEKDTNSCLLERPLNPEVKQQNVGGFWVHWLQRGFFNHEQWNWVFIMNYPAKIIRSSC